MSTFSNRPGHRASPARDIAVALERRKLDVLWHLLPAGRINGREFCVGSLAGEKGESLKVSLKGERSLWKDFATGESGGDLLDLWAQARCGGDLARAMREASEWLGSDAP